MDPVYDEFSKYINNTNKYRLKLMSDIELLNNASVIYSKNNINISNLYSLDSGLFGSTKSGECKICHQTRDCPGHYGLIPLVYPIISNSIVEDKFLKLIQIICPICSNFPITNAKESLSLKPEERFVWLQKEIKKMQIQNIHKCPYCENEFIFITYEGDFPMIKYYLYQETSNKKIQINPLLIYAILNNISDQSCEYAGFNVETFNPRNFMTKYITIIPNKLRTKTLEGSSSSLTSQYKTIIDRVLPELEQFYKSSIGTKPLIEENENSHKFNAEYFKLNAMYRLIIDMTKDSVTNACLNCINKHDKKHIDQSASMMGRFRDKKTSYFHKGIVATRHNNSTRTVLGGATEIHSNEIGFPQKYCNKLGFLVPVYKENLELMKQFVASMSTINKHDKTGIRAIRIYKPKFKENIKIKTDKALMLASRLEPGDKIYMSMIPGTLVMYNRFPSIREESCSAFEIVPTKHTVMTIPLPVCGMKNADFDGDETQIYVPSSWYTDVESLLLHSVYKVCKQYKDGTMLVYFSADTPFQLSRIKAYSKLGVKAKYYKISNEVINSVSFYPPKNILNIIEEFLDIITGHLKTDELYNYEKIAKINYCDDKLIIKDNKIDPKFCTINNQNFFIYLTTTIGSPKTLRLLDKIIQLGYNISNYNPITLGNEIRFYDKEERSKINQIHNETYEKMKLIEQSNLSFEQKAIKEFILTEQQKVPIIQSLIKQSKNTNIDEIGFVKKYQPSYYTGLINMDFVIIDGNRLEPKLADHTRTCSAFPKYSIDPCAYGYIKHGYASPFVSPVDTFYDSMVQRKSLYDKGVSIGKQGYLAKRYTMAYGPSVVDANGGVNYNDTMVSFCYGSAGIDPRLKHDLPLIDIDMDAKEFSEKYKNDEDLIELYNSIIESRNIYATITNQIKTKIIENKFVAGFDFEQFLLHNSEKGKTDKKIIDELCDECRNVFSPPAMQQRYNLMNFIQFEYYLRTKLQQVKISRDIAIELYYKFVNSLTHSGETVGLKASMAISEAFTQATLNSIHAASGGSIDVDRIKRSQGIERFEELLGGSVHKHNVITLGFYNNTKEFAQKFAKQHETIYFKHIWNKLDLRMSNNVNSKVKELHPKLNLDKLDLSKIYVRMVWNLNVLGDFDIKISEVFNKITTNYPKIMFMTGYVVNSSEFLCYIYFRSDIKKKEIDEYIQNWKSYTQINIIHGKYLTNCLVTQNQNNGDWLVIANEINQNLRTYENIIYNEDLDPAKCKTTNTKLNLELYGVFEATTRLCEETIFAGTNLAATKAILYRHYKTICQGALSDGKLLIAMSNSIEKHDGDYLRKINFEIASMFIRKAVEKGEFIEDSDMISALTFNDLPKLGSTYSKVTLFKNPNN